jgi:peroxiredoxin
MAIKSGPLAPHYLEKFLQDGVEMQECTSTSRKSYDLGETEEGPMNELWRRGILSAIFFFSPGLATAQVQEESAVDDPAMGPDYQLGKSALASQKYQEAVRAFKKANKLQNDTCSACLTQIAYAQARMGDTRGALNSAEKAVATAKSNEQRADAHAMKGDILLGENDEKKRAEAEAEYRSAVQQNSQNAENHLKLAVALMKEVKDTEGKTELNEYLKLAPDGKHAGYAYALLQNPRRAREEYAPGFSVTTIRGETISLNGLAGKFVVLDFWATWCPPCRASVGELKELTRKYPRDKVVLISVSVDKEEDKWRDFVAKKNMDWDQYRDPSGIIQRSYGIHAFPTYIVIDTEGIIRQRIVGENPQQTIVARLKTTLATLTADKGRQSD